MNTWGLVGKYCFHLRKQETKFYFNSQLSEVYLPLQVFQVLTPQSFILRRKCRLAESHT